MPRHCVGGVAVVVLSKIYFPIRSPNSIREPYGHGTQGRKGGSDAQQTTLDIRDHFWHLILAGTPRQPAHGPVLGGTQKLISPSVYQGYGAPGC